MYKAKTTSNMTPVRGKVTENVSGVWTTSSHHSREPAAQRWKDAEIRCIYTDGAAASNRPGRARGEHFQHLTHKWVHSVLGTNLCQHPVFLCLSHI